MNRESSAVRWAARALIALACLTTPGVVSAQTASAESSSATAGGTVESVCTILLFSTPDGRQYAVVGEGAACDNVVWGNDAYLDANNVVWGNDSHVNSDNVVWGNAAYFDADNVVWGNDGSDNVVWGNDGSSGSDNVVWGNDVRSDNVVWGNVTVVLIGGVW